MVHCVFISSDKQAKNFMAQIDPAKVQCEEQPKSAVELPNDFDRLWAQTEPEVRKVAARILGRGMEDDAVQNVAYIMWTRLSSGRQFGPAQFAAYACTVARHQAIRDIRVAERHRNVLRTLLSRAPVSLSAESEAVLRVLNDELRSVVQSLPEPERTAVILQMRGRRLRQIAEALGISKSSAERIVERAIGFVSQTYEQEKV